MVKHHNVFEAEKGIQSRDVLDVRSYSPSYISKNECVYGFVRERFRIFKSLAYLVVGERRTSQGRLSCLDKRLELSVLAVSEREVSVTYR